MKYIVFASVNQTVAWGQVIQPVSWTPVRKVFLPSFLLSSKYKRQNYFMVITSELFKTVTI